MLDRITFVTIGQTPRDDLVPEIVARLDAPVDVTEIGALDGLGSAEIAKLVPRDDDHALVTRLRGGGQAVIGKRWVARRLQELLDGISTEAPTTGSHATVLLCTGDFSGLSGPPLFLDAQQLVDRGVDALCHGARSVGLLVPLERQMAEHHLEPRSGQRLRAAHASPYEGDDFESAGRSLATCDVVVMHCMGYTESQRTAVAHATGRPVLLARRLVAAALSQLQ